jgi:hypothetical protein
MQQLNLSNKSLRGTENRSGIVVSLMFMMLFCTAVSLFFFSNQSLRLDEAQSLWQSGRAPGDILRVIGQDVHVPLYHTVLHFWRLFAGDTVFFARILSLIFYLAGIPLIYTVGKLAYSRKVGLFAALLFACSPFMNWYGSEVRMYTLFTLLVIANQYFFLRIMLRKESDHVWIGYAATALLGVYTHYFFFLNLGSQILFFLLRRRLFSPHALRNFLTIGVLTGAAFVPWVWYVWSLGTVSYQDPLLPTPTTVNLFSTFSQFLFGFQSDHINTFFLSLWPVGLILGFLTLRKNARLSPQTEYLMLSVLVAVFVAFALSFIVPVFVSRYLIFTIPALYLLFASMADVYTAKVALWVRWAIVVFMLVTLVGEAVNTSTPVKEEYRGAVVYLNAHSNPQDVVIVSAPFTIYPVEYYYRGSAPLATLPVWDRYSFGPIPAFAEEKLPSEVSSLTNNHQNLWLLLSYDQGYEEKIRLYFDEHYERISANTFSPNLTLYEYKLRYE